MGERFPARSQHHRGGRHGAGVPGRLFSAGDSRHGGLARLLVERSVWQSVLAALGVVVLIVLVALPTFTEPPGRDQGIYLYIGRELLAGKVPHRDIFDQRPPGTVSVYGLGMAIFGESMRAGATDRSALVPVEYGSDLLDRPAHIWEIGRSLGRFVVWHFVRAALQLVGQRRL